MPGLWITVVCRQESSSSAVVLFRRSSPNHHSPVTVFNSIQDEISRILITQQSNDHAVRWLLISLLNIANNCMLQSLHNRCPTQRVSRLQPPGLPLARAVSYGPPRGHVTYARGQGQTRRRSRAGVATRPIQPRPRISDEVWGGGGCCQVELSIESKCVFMCVCIDVCGRGGGC